jgi:hypothetical protein
MNNLHLPKSCGNPSIHSNYMRMSNTSIFNCLKYQFIYAWGYRPACWPAVYDFIPGSAATTALENENTEYYTIAGDWIPHYNPFIPLQDPNCSPPSWLPLQRWATNEFVIAGDDDGIVPFESAASDKFVALGHTNNCHTYLLGEEEYDLARDILLGLE